MKILMIIPEFGYGGAEKSFSILSKQLSRDYEIINVVFNLNFQPVYEVGGRVISLDIQPGRHFFDKTVKFIQRIRKLRKIKKTLKPQVAISFLEGANYINALTTNKKEKTIISVRGSKNLDQNISSSFGFLRRKVLTPLLYAKSDFIVALSKGIRQELLSTYSQIESDTIRVIYNAVDFQKIEKLSTEAIPPPWQKLYDTHKTIIAVSRLAEEKGLHLFIPIFAELIKNNPKLKLLIIGDGPFLNQLRAICVNSKLTLQAEQLEQPGDHDVYFFGYQDNPFKWVAKANLFISSSIHEGFGNAIIEAMACKTPVVSTDCEYGPREIINDTTSASQAYPNYGPFGILLPNLYPKAATSEQIWLDTLTKLINDEEKLEKYAGMSAARASHFTEGELIKGWKALISL